MVANMVFAEGLGERVAGQNAAVVVAVAELVVADMVLVADNYEWS